MNNLKSYHIFLFPFKWDFKTKAVKDIEEITLYDRTKIENFHELILENGWENNDFKVVDGATYSERTYFYDFASDVIHGESKTTSIIRRFRYPLKDAENATYTIEIEKEENEEIVSYTYQLSIDKITLNCYEPGVAVLGFHLANYDARTTAQDILNINDYGRRIYPQFMGKTADEKFDLQPVQNTFLAKKIILKGVMKNLIEEDFSNYQGTKNLNKPRISKFINNLLGENFKSSPSETNVGDMLVLPVIDDRMYAICWYGNREFSRALKKFSASLDSYNYETNDLWQQMIFMTNRQPISSHIKLKKELINKHTLGHDIGGGTLIGVTRYSLMFFSDERKIPIEKIIQNLKTIHYQIAQLALVQRASILRFSEEIAYISALEQDNAVILTTRSLYKDYLIFINKIYFREVTAQREGIELYEDLQRKMKIERDIKDLDTEIEELHSYTSMLEEKALLEEDRKQNNILNRLTIIGALLLVPTFISGYFGMNMFSDKLEPHGVFDLLAVVLGILGITSVAYFYITTLDKKSKITFKEKSGEHPVKLRNWELLMVKAAPVLIILILLMLMLLPFRHIR